MTRRDQRPWPHPGLLLPLAPSLLAVILWLGFTVLVRVADPAAGGSVYTVAQMRAHLASDRRAWLGRTVWVRGIAITSGCAQWSSPELASCRHWQGIVDVPGASLLPVTAGAQDPLLAFLRRLPLAGQLVPPPQAVHWGAVATYRVQLRAAPAGSCPSPPCYQALLLDAAPDSP